MDRTNTNVDCGKTLPLGLPGSVAVGASILRRPLRLPVQGVSALVVDQDGESHQERLLLPVGRMEDILQTAYGQIGMELVALDWLPDETMVIEVIDTDPTTIKETYNNEQ